jgi:hypothetical protein
VGGGVIILKPINATRLAFARRPVTPGGVLHAAARLRPQLAKPVVVLRDADRDGGLKRPRFFFQKQVGGVWLALARGCVGSLLAD